MPKPKPETTIDPNINPNPVKRAILLATENPHSVTRPNFYAKGDAMSTESCVSIWMLMDSAGIKPVSGETYAITIQKVDAGK